MGLKIRMNARELEVGISQVAKKALENGARSLRRIATRIQKLAIEYAPVDDGDLERSIKMEEDGRDERGRKRFIVYVDPDQPAMTDDDGDVTKVVGDYAYIMENGRYKLGPKSQEKDGGSGKVGRKFMARAIKEGSERAIQDVATAVQLTLQGRGGRRAPGVNPIRNYRDEDGEQ